jgi:hypothetical protein
MKVAKKDIPPALTSETVLWARACPVCRELLYTIVDRDYEKKGEVNRACVTVDDQGSHTTMCDYADMSGCHAQYHDNCFDSHTCAVHNPGDHSGDIQPKR